MEQARSIVRLWAERHRQAVLYDDDSAVLLDVASGKRLKIAWPALSSYEEKVHPETQEAYIVMLFDDGTQLALVDPGGVAFAPSTVNSGAVENLPAVVCLRDLLMLKQRVDHYALRSSRRTAAAGMPESHHDLHRDLGRRPGGGIRCRRSRRRVGEVAR